MVITLSDSGNTKIYFPVNPQQIGYKSATYFREYNVINKGASKVPAGEEISTINWESFFPGEDLQDNLPFLVKKNTNPKSLHNQIESWRKKGTKLKLNITGTPFSMWVYIDTYEAAVQDAYGSIYYTIEFSKAITMEVETVKKKKSTAKTSGNKRTSKNSSAKKYTVKRGDCLWKISKKFYKKGSQWKKIYNANKETIEKAAKKHGKKSSNHGWWIYPGTVLKIPR